MSDEILILSIVFIGLLGLALTFHLFFFEKRNVPAKILGWYTLLMTISSVEPLKQYFDKATYLTSPIEMVIGTVSFMIGPMLFLYCKYRLMNRSKWREIDSLHFIPAAMLFILIAISPNPSFPEHESTTDVIFYLLFICHLFSYTLSSFFVIINEKKRRTNASSLSQFHFNFVLFLVVSSMTLFLYSFGSTLLGASSSFQFKVFIQGFLTLIIIVIVFLNAETLEDHQVLSKAEKTFKGENKI